MTAIAPRDSAAIGATPRSAAPDLLRRHRRHLVAAAVLLFLGGLLAIDHGGPPPVVHEAVGRGVVTAGSVSVTSSGDPRVQVQPGTLQVSIDGAGLFAASVTVVSTAGQPLVVDARARLISSGARLLTGYADGGTVVPAHGSAVLRLSGSPPVLAIGTVELQLHATVEPPATR